MGRAKRRRGRCGTCVRCPLQYEAVSFALPETLKPGSYYCPYLLPFGAELQGEMVEIHPLRVRAPLSESDFSSVSRFDLFFWMVMQH